MAKKKALGKGLEALLDKSNIPTSRELDPTPPITQATPQSGNLLEIAIEKIRPGISQPRQDFDAEELEQLAESIKSQGILQPVLVRAINSAEGNLDHYELIAGERRWRASQQAGLKTIPALLKENDDQSSMAMALIENLQRSDLNAMELSLSLNKIRDQYGITQEDLAKQLGMSRPHLANLLRLKNLLPQIQEMVRTKQLEMGHARVLASLEETRQLGIANKVLAQQLSVRQLEQLVRSKTPLDASKETPEKTIDPDVTRLSQHISDQLGTKTTIRYSTTKGTGQMTIHFASSDQLENLLTKMHLSKE